MKISHKYLLVPGALIAFLAAFPVQLLPSLCAWQESLIHCIESEKQESARRRAFGGALPIHMVEVP